MKGKKILVIEPDFESLKSLSRFLLDAKFDVMTAYDGEEGLRKAKTENPDLVILEPRLSKMSGFDLCSIIARDFEKKIPVIILTEFFKDFKAEILHSFGAAAYFCKPYDKEELFYTILDLLKERGDGKAEEEIKSSKQIAKPIPEKHQERLELESEKKDSTGSNGNGNGDIKQLENLLSSFKFDAGRNLKICRDNRGNGSQKNNGREPKEKNMVDNLLKDVLSEFGLASPKKTSIQKDIRDLNDFIASF